LKEICAGDKPKLLKKLVEVIPKVKNMLDYWSLFSRFFQFLSIFASDLFIPNSMNISHYLLKRAGSLRLALMSPKGIFPMPPLFFALNPMGNIEF